MDEGAIGHGNQSTRGKVECCLNCCKYNFSHNCTLPHVINIIITTSTSYARVVTTRAISIDSTQFQVTMELTNARHWCTVLMQHSQYSRTINMYR